VLVNEFRSLLQAKGLFEVPLMLFPVKRQSKYKGGHVEKDLLMKRNIPCLNLETSGCPKQDKPKHIIPKKNCYPVKVFLPMTLLIIVLPLNVMLFGIGTKVSLQNMQTSDYK